MKNIVVLISGNGSNLQAIIDACDSRIKHGHVVAVFSDKADAYGLSRAEDADIPAIALNPKDFADRATFDAELMQRIDNYQPDLVVLAGYMRILSGTFVSHYLGKMINIHPSLLPKYPGLHTHQRAIDDGESQHGTSVHFVTEELDSGPVIVQAKVPVFEDDTADVLRQRVQVQEHSMYPLAIEWFVSGRLTMLGNDAFLDGQKLGASGYASDDE